MRPLRVLSPSVGWDPKDMMRLSCITVDARWMRPLRVLPPSVGFPRVWGGTEKDMMRRSCVAVAVDTR